MGVNPPSDSTESAPPLARAESRTGAAETIEAKGAEPTVPTTPVKSLAAQVGSTLTSRRIQYPEKGGSDASLRPGQRIRVVGVTELNGPEGVAVQWDEHKSLWRVRMSDGRDRMFKRAELEK